MKSPNEESPTLNDYSMIQAHIATNNSAKGVFPSVLLDRAHQQISKMLVY